jgi:hypothetical protein
MRSIICILPAIILFTSCNNNGSSLGNWSVDDKDKWMKECTEPLEGTLKDDVARKYCFCVLEQAEKKYPNFKQMKTKGTTDEGKEMGKNCTHLVTGGSEPGN